MSIYEGGKTTARGWRSRKIYLSDEAHQLLSDHCRNTPLTISAWIDMAIKRELDSPAERFLRGADLSPAEREQRREEKEMLLGPEPAVPPVKHTDIRSDPSQRNHPKERALGKNRDADGFEKQPRKDFKVDL